jgi:hypothetical protein
MASSKDEGGRGWLTAGSGPKSSGKFQKRWLSIIDAGILLVSMSPILNFVQSESTLAIINSNLIHAEDFQNSGRS